jgi:phage terminase Nu1 subunit (DNA packaging protein)
MEKQLITTKELSASISLSPRTIQRYMKLGLPHFKVNNGRPLFSLDAVMDWLKNYKRPEVTNLRSLRRDNNGVFNLRGKARRLQIQTGW